MVESESVSFAWVLDRLAGNPLAGGGTGALKVRRSDGFYIPPQFEVTQRSESAPVVLLSARGAAGKSATADALSEQLGAPVWRLEDDSAVSEASVHSTLVRHLGRTDPSEGLRATERPLLIIDSMDEAKSRVSATSWIEFIRALIDAIENGLRVLFCGRTRTLEDLWVTLEEAGVDSEWLEVSHLDAEARVRYINARAQARDPHVHVGREAYGSARGAILSALEEPLAQGEAERFLGYPPVLDAVAQLLVRKANHLALRNEFSSMHGRSRTDVLQRILNHILDREQGKIAPLARDLDLDPKRTYGPEEQVQWLLHDVEGAAPPSLEYIVDVPVRMDYVRSLAEFRRDHPFRNDARWASPVFQAHVVAESFDSAPAEAVLRAGRVSGLLFELVSGRASGELLLDEPRFAALHASLLAGQWLDADASVAVGAEAGSFTGVFASDSSHLALRFLLVNARPEAVELLGPLTGLTVNIDGDIDIPASTGDVVLGPDLFLRGRRIHIRGERAGFGFRGDSHGVPDVTLQATAELVLPPDIAPPAPPPSMVDLFSSDPLPFPWNVYAATDLESAPPDLDDRAVRFLNKFMNLTRTHGHGGERAVFIKKFEGRQGLRPEQFRVALAVLEQLGVAHEDDDMVYYASAWEPHRYHGKSSPGQRQLEDCIDEWRPVLVALGNALSRWPSRR